MLFALDLKVHLSFLGDLYVHVHLLGLLEYDHNLTLLSEGDGTLMDKRFTTLTAIELFQDDQILF